MNVLDRKHIGGIELDLPPRSVPHPHPSLTVGGLYWRGYEILERL
jgi:hypothetical protein